MATKVTICSNAAILVGSKPIADLTEDTTEAQLTSNLFEIVRDELLRSHPWTFSIKRINLSASITKPAYGFKHEFNCPSDMLKLISVDNIYNIDFIFENKKILANQSSISIRYLYRNEDISSWAADFISALTYELAAQIAYPIAKSDSLRQTLLQKALYELRIAKSNNGFENPGQGINDNPLLSARY